MNRLVTTGFLSAQPEGRSGAWSCALATIDHDNDAATSTREQCIERADLMASGQVVHAILIATPST